MGERPPYQELDPEKVVGTIEALQRRIGERFPDSGLRRVCGQLLSIARQAQAQAAWIEKPIVSLRLATAALVGLILVGLIGTFAVLELPRSRVDFFEFVQALEAGINDVVLLGVAIFFLVTLERRIKRRRGLRALHSLRALAHIIDMHQLTKDPDRISREGKDTASSPAERLTPFLLSRYLDYCSEMLSLTGKVAVLYVQKFDDPVVLSTVNEIEDLTTGLSRKIWQKLMIMHLGKPAPRQS